MGCFGIVVGNNLPHMKVGWLLLMELIVAAGYLTDLQEQGLNAMR